MRIDKPNMVMLFPRLRCMAVLIWSASVYAALPATVSVTSTADNGPGSLRNALAIAAAGDTVDARAVSGVIRLTSGELLVTKSLTILGPGPGTLAVDGNQANRVFHIAGAAPATVEISGMTVTNGYASGFNLNNGGGINLESGVLTVSNCTVSGNTSVFGNGGGIASTFGSLTIVNSMISSNSAGTGGGIANDYGSLTVIGSVISGNTAGSRSGGIENLAYGGSATLIVANSTLSGNTAPAGAAIYNLSTGGYSASVTVSNSTLSANSAMNGGGVYNDGDVGGSVNTTLVIVNSTLSGNSATNRGGGIVNSHGGVVCTHVTFSGNSATNAGGISSTSGSFSIRDTIFNAGASGANITGTIQSLGFNLSSDAAGGDGTTGPGGLLNSNGDIRNTDPRLGPLQDNGGPTLTYALLPGSPAIDAGDTWGLATDQRGRPRPYDNPNIPKPSGGDGSDIGAFELVPPSLSVARSGNSITLSWKTPSPGFVLYQNSNPANPGGWTPYAGSISDNGVSRSATLSASTGTLFFRLGP